MASVYTFSYWDEYLGKKADRPLSSIRATRVHRVDPDTIALRYQSTDVVTYHRDGSYTLNSGGWQTSTTKSRMNEYSPARIWQDRGLWYVRTGPTWERTDRVAYVDPMRIGPDGYPLAPATERATEKRDESKRKLDRYVSRFCKAFADHVAAHGLDTPGPGDCLMCQMELANAMGTPKPVANVGRGTLGANGQLQVTDTTHARHPLGVDHYLSHMAENYFVPSLYALACVDAHYGGGPAIGWQMGITRRDASWVRRELTRYFRKLKPQLLTYVQDGWTPEREREASNG